MWHVCICLNLNKIIQQSTHLAKRGHIVKSTQKGFFCFVLFIFLVFSHVHQLGVITVHITEISGVSVSSSAAAHALLDAAVVAMAVWIFEAKTHLWAIFLQVEELLAVKCSAPLPDDKGDRQMRCDALNHADEGQARWLTFTSGVRAWEISRLNLVWILTADLPRILTSINTVLLIKWRVNLFIYTQI